MFGLPLESLIVIGLVFKAMGFLIRDELRLRLFVVSGMSCDMIYYGFKADPVWNSVMTSGFLTVINLGLIAMIVFERTTFQMSPEKKELFAFFPTLRVGQFRRILRYSTWHYTEEPVQIITEGKSLDALYFIDGPRFDVIKQGKTYPALGPAFSGELVFLNSGLSSATVVIPAQTRYIEIDAKRLHRAMKRSPALNNGMIALFGRDLARKVANSVPIQKTTAPVETL